MTDGPRPNVPIWLLAMLTFSGTLAMHIFVPALLLAANDLRASPGSMQMTVSFYIFGLALGQLIYGPLSDRFGRRPPLMAGLALYAVSGLAAACAPSSDALIAARLFQALGGCAGLVLARAIVRDLAGPTEAARRLALMNLMVTIGPGIAPLAGGAIAYAAGWRSIFLLLCGLGIANLVFAWRLLPETSTPSSGNDMRALARNYRQLIGSPAFLGYSVGGGCATTSLYAFISAAPFIFFNRLNRPAHEVGFFLAVIVAGMALGSFLASRLISRVAIAKLLVRANALSLAAAAVFLCSVLSAHLTVPLTVGTMFLYAIGVGIASPAALTEAISINPHVVGSASGLYGFTQMGVGAICTALAGLGDDPALSAGIVLTGAGIVAQTAFWIALRSRRPV